MDYIRRNRNYMGFLGNKKGIIMNFIEFFGTLIRKENIDHVKMRIEDDEYEVDVITKNYKHTKFCETEEEAREAFENVKDQLEMTSL